MADTTARDKAAQMIKELRRDGYGLCKNCGGVESFEVLRQMEGFCTSECARDHGDD